MTSLLSENASQDLVNHLADLIERKVDERLAQKEKRYMCQKEVMKFYGASHEELKDWEILGLKRRKQGRMWMYDRHDIENLFEKMKE